MDKLAFIKQKYGYVSTSNTNYSSITLAGKQNSAVKSTEYHRKDSQCIIPAIPAERVQPAQPSNTKLISELCPPLPPKQVENAYSSNSNRQPLKEVKPNQNEKPNFNESIVKSYEKTYDLLKNYRNRIVMDIQPQKAQNLKRLNLGKSLPKQSQQKQIQRRQQELSEKQIKESLVASQMNQRMEKKAYPKRCSPLEGIDIKGSCNIYAEIDNISRLQNRIKQLVGERSFR